PDDWCGESAVSPSGRRSAAAAGQAARAPALAAQAGARAEPPLVLQRPEGRVRGLALTLGGEEARLPPREARLVLDQEPDHHLDTRVRAGDRVRLREVLRLRPPRDAEDAIRRASLVAVFGDPDRLLPVEPGQFSDEITEVRSEERRVGKA